MKHYFLGLAAGRKGAWRQLFTHGSKKDTKELCEFLEKRYGGEAMLCKNGRSALTLALLANFKRGDLVLVNGFTCYAVYEAVKAAGMVPVFTDIERKTLNMDLSKIDADNAKGIVVQNTLGNPVDMVAVEKFAKENGLLIIEDLAHSVGRFYPDGREAGTVGVATVLSFGKEKAIDTTSGEAVVFRGSDTIDRGPRPSGPSTKGRSLGVASNMRASSPTLGSHSDLPRADGANPRAAALRNARDSIVSLPPRPSDYLRDRWYPTFAAWARGLSYIHLGGIFMRALTKIHFVERSADNRLDLTRRMPYFEAKLALIELKKLKKSGEGPLREFYLVRDREKCLAELKRAGYYFDGLWYEKPVSPVRYYKKVHFDEAACPVATEVASKIVNLPNYYSKKDLAKARAIIKKYEEAK